MAHRDREIQKSDAHLSLDAEPMPSGKPTTGYRFERREQDRKVTARRPGEGPARRAG